MGLILSLTGLYGLVAHSASRRTREIGIRMAVGATPASVLTLVLRHGLALTGAGLALGGAGSAAISGALHAAFPSVESIGAGAYALVVPLILAVTIAAAYVPARRASRLDPLRALRTE
jgi:ABC-type antimicrobial peptide transport system permease subunit